MQGIGHMNHSLSGLILQDIDVSLSCTKRTDARCNRGRKSGVIDSSTEDKGAGIALFARILALTRTSVQSDIPTAVRLQSIEDRSFRGSGCIGVLQRIRGDIEQVTFRGPAGFELLS